MSELRQVTASAGSGKTYQLTRRFLRLLDSAEETRRPFVCTGNTVRGYAWPEIMAVTFTNKAAAEMKERVIAGLKLSALCVGDAGQRAECSSDAARHALESILRRYHRLNIRTIDSLLALLLRVFALEFGVRPDFEIAFDESDLFDEVADHFATMCETDCPERDLLSDAFETMIRAEGRKGFWVQTSLRQRLKELITHRRAYPGPVLTDQTAIKDLLATAFARFQASADDLAVHLHNTGMPVHKRFLTFLDNCRNGELFTPPKASAYATKEDLRAVVSKAGKDNVDSLSEAKFERFKAVYAEYAATHAILSGAYFLAPAVELADRFRSGLQELQRQRGVISGADLPGIVNDLLSEVDAVSEAYCRLGSRLHHLLVDEFQDTSREQWQAVTPLAQECLAKGGSLFYVGDVKQAIYSWRGGDAALFDEVMRRPEVASLARDAHTEKLPDNWRSARHVVECNNAFFQRLEDGDDARELAGRIFKEADEDFLASFAADLAHNFNECLQSVAPKNADTEGYVRMTRLPGGKTDEVDEQTLAALGPLMDDLTARRPFKDIAVLVRKHDHAALVCDLLVNRGVPVVTENSLQLNRHAVVRQLIGLLGFLDFPRDDVSFLTFVLGPELFLAESGLGERELHDWLIRPKRSPLGVHFRDDYPDAWTRFIEPFYNQSGLMTPYDLAQEAIRAFRVLERHPDSELYVRRFLEVVHLAEEKGYGSLSAFLDYWAAHSDEEKVPLPENIDAVRIMTIHKSKGLEFPVVVVPFHNWSLKPAEDFVERRHAGHRLLVPMVKGLGKARFASLGRSAREQLNLLYVAWTRARKELYGFFTEKPENFPALAAMDLFLELDDDGVFEYGARPQAGIAAQPGATAPPDRLPPDETAIQLMEWLPRLRVYRHNLDECFYNERIRGEVAHRVMERLRITGDDAADIARALDLAAAEFPALDALPVEEQERLHRDLRAMAEWVLGDERLRVWLADGLKEPEVMDAQGKFKRLDLLYRGDDLVVADFKTGRPDPKNRAQVLDYMQLLAAMPGENGAPKGYLIYLDLQEIHEVGEAS